MFASKLIISVAWASDDNFNLSLNTPFYKQIEGEVVIHPNKTFGFIGHNFISPEIVTKYNLHNGDTIKGIVARAYDKKKEKFSWCLHRIM